MIIGSKLLSSFLMSVICFFWSIYATNRQGQAAVTLKIHNSGLDNLGATHFLTLRHPCLGFYPYFGNHWARSINPVVGNHRFPVCEEFVTGLYHFPG